MRWFDAPEDKALPGGIVPLCRTTDRAIWALVAVFLVLGTVYSVVTPLFEAPDEAYHYPFVEFLADGHGLPIQDPAAPALWHQEGSQPPLYYALAALVSRWAPADDLPQVLRRNPHADTGVPRPDGNANIVVHTPREAWPYHGATLAVHLARELSVILGALTVLFTYLNGLEVLPRRPGLALAAAAVVAFTPMFLFISGSVNNDNLVVALTTIALWLILRLLRLPSKPGHWAALGGLVGLTALAKVSGLALLAPAGLAVAFAAWRRHDRRLLGYGGACLLGAVALVAGWWYYRNWRLYHDPLGWSAFLAIVGRRFPQPTLRQLLAEWPGFIKSYWGVFGWFNVLAPAWYYRLCDGLALVAAGGFLVEAGRRLLRRQWPTVDTLFRLALVASWPLIMVVGVIRWTMLTPASQGRLMFPAIAPLSYLLVLGWASYVPGAAQTVAHSAGDSRTTQHAARFTHHVSRFAFYVSRIVPPALFAALAVWAPFGIIAPAYARPPLLTPAQEARVPQRLDLVLGEQMELLGYEIVSSEVRPGQDLAVTLYWRAKAPMADDYSVFVHLLAENELIVGQRDRYPGRGNFPTSQWQAGDAIADTYTIPVSPTTFSPTHAVIEVGLYHHSTGERLPIRDAQGRPLGDHIRFGEVLVRAEPRNGIANPLSFNFDNKMALVGYDMDRTALRPDETLHLTLYWQALAPMDRDYTVFAHVLGANDSIWAQKDSWPQDGAAPTSTWQAGQVIADGYDLVIKPETPPGVFELEVGVYLAKTGKRLSVLDAAGQAQDNRVLLNRVRVAP